MKPTYTQTHPETDTMRESAAVAAADPYAPFQWFVERGYPSPRGLLMGLGSVLLFQIVVVLYYATLRYFDPDTVQYKKPKRGSFLLELWGHLARPESFFMTFAYLCSVWMFRLMPASYFDLESPLNWWHVLAQMLVVDTCTFLMHLVEHVVPRIYIPSHKPHHVWINPKMFDAFNGSPLDTFGLILIPLFMTCHICNFVNTWEFIAFGTIYANQFTLIHCEYPHVWDGLFSKIGIGTAADHSVHHALFNYNYGHFFVYCDLLWGTYRSPSSVKQFRASGMLRKK
eukprot:CAMPEP_0174243998 /NCGR_PEP_ID=MMETSP0417-20130205/33616_1 /TAXON_ID=242541 /ORGANISM="Mayorella sp, Strain BSH-02190019" /LENGTH=283 /DNA_ID=CAMNT_0015323613 /DNA_START=6 /DNA_END=857 /DNA_ORIENTATION=-